MAQWRHTTDNVASRLSNEVGIGATKFFTDQSSYFVFTDSVVSRSHHNDRLATRLRPKYDRLGNLSDRATNRCCSFGTGSGRLFEFDNLGQYACFGKYRLRSEGSRMLSW